MGPYDVALLIYDVASVPIALFSLSSLAFSFLTLVDRSPAISSAERSSFRPSVTVQIACFDDPVAIRCAEACLRFDYPSDRVSLMLLDDSVDIDTSRQLRDLAEAHPDRVTYLHRSHRRGFKAGALADAMPLVKSDLVALFDADFVPAPDLLADLVAPFEDPRVGIVQARQGFLNAERTLVARFASYLLSVHHHVMLPVAARFGAVLFCGTAGALRVRAIDDAGGWDPSSITEDAELSVRLLARGWRSIYVTAETPSEVPESLRGFLRQQMRWCFGGLRVFVDHAGLILFGGDLRASQRAMITFLTLGNVISPAVVVITLAGVAGWLFLALGAAQPEPSLHMARGPLGFACTASFLFGGAVALARRGKLRELPWLVLGAFSVAIALAFANSIAVVRALVFSRRPLFGRAGSWVCTPKAGNAEHAAR